MKILRNITLGAFILNVVIGAISIIANMVISRNGNMEMLVDMQMISLVVTRAMIYIILVILIVGVIYSVITKNVVEKKSRVFLIIGLGVFIAYVIALNISNQVIYAILDGSKEYSLENFVSSDSFDSIVLVRAIVLIVLYVLSVVFSVIGMKKPECQDVTMEMERIGYES